MPLSDNCGGQILPKFTPSGVLLAASDTEDLAIN